MTNWEKEFTTGMRNKELTSFTDKLHYQKYQEIKSFNWKSGKNMTKQFKYKKFMAISITIANENNNAK